MEKMRKKRWFYSFASQVSSYAGFIPIIEEIWLEFMPLMLDSWFLFSFGKGVMLNWWKLAELMYFVWLNGVSDNNFFRFNVHFHLTLQLYVIYDGIFTRKLWYFRLCNHILENLCLVGLQNFVKITFYHPKLYTILHFTP